MTGYSNIKSTWKIGLINIDNSKNAKCVWPLFLGYMKSCLKTTLCPKVFLSILEVARANINDYDFKTKISTHFKKIGTGKDHEKKKELSNKNPKKSDSIYAKIISKMKDIESLFERQTSETKFIASLKQKSLKSISKYFKELKSTNEKIQIGEECAKKRKEVHMEKNPFKLLSLFNLNMESIMNHTPIEMKNISSVLCPIYNETYSSLYLQNITYEISLNPNFSWDFMFKFSELCALIIHECHLSIDNNKIAFVIEKYKPPTVNISIVS